MGLIQKFLSILFCLFVVFTARGQNNPPVANNDSVIINQDSQITYDVQDNDFDPDLDPLETIIMDAPSNGVAYKDFDEDIRYIPDTLWSGRDTVKYMVKENGTSPELWDSAYFFITVLPANQAPVANIDGAAGVEDTAFWIDVQDNDYDPDFEKIYTSLYTAAPFWGTAQVFDQDSILYTPNANYNGFDLIYYMVCDSTGLCDSSVVGILVSAINDAPIAVDDNLLVNEDDSIQRNLLANDIDVDGNLDSTSIVFTSTPAFGTLTDYGNGLITYTPFPNVFGSDQLKYIVCDYDLACDSAIVHIDIVPVNDYPIANTDSMQCLEDVIKSINVLVNDSDIDGFLDLNSLLIIVPPVNGSAVAKQDSSITYIPNLNYWGDDSFQYAIYDNENGGDSAWVIINLAPVNDAPIAVIDSTKTPENTPVQVDVLANDIDVEGPLFPSGVNILLDPLHGDLLVQFNGDYQYTPREGFTGVDSFTYIICDQGKPVLCDSTVVYIATSKIGVLPPEEEQLQIPTGFSPNSDGLNDRFVVMGTDSDLQLVVYDRWGNVVYSASAYDNQWKGQNLKGKDLPDGTYFYLLRSDNGLRYQGYITLRR